MSVVVIAEAGVNHNGSLENARRLVDAACEAGADYVKFQTFKAEKLASKAAVKAAYQKQHTGGGSQFDMLKQLELNEAAHLELIAYCKQKGIAFLSTAFDLESIDLLRKLGITLGKIPSGEITNLPYLQKMATTFSNVILSTGMANIEEVKEALEVLMMAGLSKDQITVLHCTTEYPAPLQEVNLKAMQYMGVELGIRVGYSDHTEGIEVPIAAVAMGATIIEKHFTLDKSMPGPDHKASLEPGELIAMVKAIRNIELALGVEVKQPTPSEIKNKEVARKSIIAARNLKTGQILSESDIIMKRPGNGISPMELPRLLGRKLKVDVPEDTLLDYNFFE